MNNYYTIEPTQHFQGNGYASWQPDASTNNKIQVDTNWKYRQYMQKNANDIMKYNTMQSINTSGNNPYTVLNANPTETAPYLYNSLHDANTPMYGFRDSDLKRDFLNKQQFKSRMVAPSIRL